MPLFVTVKVAVRGLCQSSVPNSTVVGELHFGLCQGTDACKKHEKGEGYEVFHEKNVVCEWVKAIMLPYINTLCASRIYIICVYHAYI